MKLQMSGHQSTTVLYVTAEVLKSESSGNSKGYFKTEIDWNVVNGKLILKFKNTIFINKALDSKLKKDIHAHEHRHFADFKVLAEKLKAGIDKALKEGRDPEMSDRIDWLKFDRCQRQRPITVKTTASPSRYARSPRLRVRSEKGTVGIPVAPGARRIV